MTRTPLQTLGYGIGAALEEIEEADSLGETRFSGLFHSARTSAAEQGKYTAFCEVEDGDLKVREVRRLFKGSWRPEVKAEWDLLVSLPPRAFMDTADARDRLRRQLREAQREVRRKQ